MVYNLKSISVLDIAVNSLFLYLSYKMLPCTSRPMTGRSAGRPPSARPPSARPAAPRVRERKEAEPEDAPR